MKQHTLLLLTGMLSLTACASTIEKLERTGKQPPLTKVENPQTRPDYQPVSWPLPDPEASSVRTANSLWQPGSRAFFRDQRAARVGDILRVNVSINDQAQLDNKTNRNRNSTENVAAPIAFGFEKKLPGNPAALADITSDTQTTSDGKIDRKEKITTQIAALVTQVLPNGNLVIEGTQEILVNYEIREVAINGVIRPQDINSDNTIDSTQVAQARITYSGRGQISDVQQPRWGQQVFEAIMPF
ncbi:MAG: flagellar basal body L-ring protein FlgH [Alphaproteobacteria bacterium]|nr:flagellar basal body L-ring protein FlgH [Alphaproteobacteria bacterium]